ncbi:MAG: HK97 family phage prohead protease [Treponema sp.]|uniref:HK97 family phage prohead protease n=1 Tax=Treponema sp. TaxID=166 RepID=UPI00257996E9|nr:HK97 family phage prohead protease [Treponema sp.]MBQ9102516.1 HK97 family phage prohead protease [Treponema sp.]
MKPNFKTEKDELRSFDFEIRAAKDEQNGTFIEGVPIVFDKKCDMGYFEEYISRDALSKTDMKDVRFLVNHNIEMTPLARSRNNNANSTMQMEVKEDGMHIRVNLDTENNTDAKNLYSAIQRGDVSGMSFMFVVRGDKWEKLDSDYPKRTITDIEKIFEVSAVTFPAYEDTSIKARSVSALESARQELESKRAEELKSEEAKRENEERNRSLTLLELQTF